MDKPVAYCPFCGQATMCIREETRHYYCANTSCVVDQSIIDEMGKTAVVLLDSPAGEAIRSGVATVADFTIEYQKRLKAKKELDDE